MMRNNRKILALLLSAAMVLAPVSGVHANDRAGSADAVDGAAGLADGTYMPDKFSWSGGSGRIDITCTGVTVSSGQAYATIVFSSDSYAYVKVNGTKYTGTVSDGSTVFEIPVELNENNEIIGMTTKMSSAHEITYSIYVYLAAADHAAGKEEGGSGMDSDAPEIAGLQYRSATETGDARYFKIYNYSDGIKLLEIELGIEDAAKYLIVPEGVEIPAGLEKEMDIVNAPAEHIYVASEDAMESLEASGAADVIAAAAFTAEDYTAEWYSEALEQGTIAFAGSWEQPDFAQLIKSGCDLALLPSEFLHREEESSGENTEYLEQIITGFETLEIPLVVDRSADEETEQAKDEWKKLYAALLGLEAQTETADTEKTSEISYITEAENAPQVAGLTCEGQMRLDFARCFQIYFYEGGYALLDVAESGQYLVVPESMEVPEGLNEEIVVLQQPLNHIYLQATSAMALFRALDSLDNVRMTGTQADGWYIDETVEKMENGEMLFAGKYSEPDYEMLIDEGCDLALESTMILHSPKVQEMIEMLGIPVFIDRASYETEPLGRSEWIKLYGVMMDKEQDAAEFFEEQTQVLDEVADFENTGKTIAFFYVNTDGSVVVRKKTDYISGMIELAGGNNVYGENWPEDQGNSSIKLTMEEFYAEAKDADYMVYNATIANELGSVDELLAENELFAEFKAVREGNVWTTTKQLFQATDILGELIADFHHMLTGQGDMTFLKKVD